MADLKVTDFGAVPDGKTKSTAAFDRAMKEAGSNGGGCVVVPAGEYLTGPIHFQSKVQLHLCRGAKILFSRDYDDYPMVNTDWEGLQSVRCISPIWGTDLEQIAITGEGVIDGQGEAWRPVKRFKMSDEQWKRLISSGGVVDPSGQIWFPTEAAMKGSSVVNELRAKGDMSIEAHKPIRDYLRPNMVKFTGCRQLLLDGPTFQNSAAWNVHLLMCENVVVKNVRILNPWYSANGDAIDIDSCRNVTVSHAHFDCGDDAICIKSGKDEDGRKRARPSENIDIVNCTVVHGHGGVTIGSEMSGGVRNVRVANCIFEGTDIGLRFKSTRGRGGVVENIEMSNVTMKDIRHEAISVNLYYFVKNPKPEPVSERTPRFRDMVFRNIQCVGAKQAIEVRGLPEMPVEAIKFENVRMSAERGVLLTDARDITLSGVRITAKHSPVLHCHNVSGLSCDHFDGDGPVDDISKGHGGDL